MTAERGFGDSQSTVVSVPAAFGGSGSGSEGASVGPEDKQLRFASSTFNIPPKESRLSRSQSTPEAVPKPTIPARASSAQADILFAAQGSDAPDVKEIAGLVQELGYHTDTSHKQLQELCERLNVESSTPPTVAPSSTEPTPNPSSGSTSSPSEPRMRRRPSGVRSRMEVRLQISNFLKVARHRIKVMTLWRHEAELQHGLQSMASCLTGRNSERWYKKLYNAYEVMFSNFLDENDSPIREVVFDVTTHEVKRAAWRAGVAVGRECGGRPTQVEAIRRALQCFAEAVIAVRGRPEPHTGPSLRIDSFDRNQWMDCLLRVTSQFERVLEETWRRVWPDPSDDCPGSARRTPGSIAGSHQDPGQLLESLRQAMAQNMENAELMRRASAAMSSGCEPKDLSQFSVAYLRQAIQVSKSFLNLAREMTLLTGLLTTSREGEENETLSQAVLKQEYRRVRRAVADLLFLRRKEILDAWSMRVAKEMPALSRQLGSYQDRQINKRFLSAVIEWWRSGHSGTLRAVSMDTVAFRFNRDVREDAMGRLESTRSVPVGPQRSVAESARPDVEAGEEDLMDLGLEQLQTTIHILEEVVLETLRREFSVRSVHSGVDLSQVDEPRIRDILARLTHELNSHLDSEWHILQSAQRSSNDVLPPPALFQPPHWSPSKRFDYSAVKTAFLGAEIQQRYVVTRYVNRGGMGRVWVVEDRISPPPFPLCLKTFYCECESEDMSNLTRREFKRCVLEELSQVERWMTTRTRLASSKHLVRVEKVLRDAPIVRPGGPGGKVEGCISGIIMEYCDKGELTSYLWDDKLHEPRAFDEFTARYLFAQTTQLLIELFAPTPIFPTDRLNSMDFREVTCMSFDSEDAKPIYESLPRTLSISFGSVDSHLMERVNATLRRNSDMTPVASSQLMDRGDSMHNSPFITSLTERTNPVRYFHNDIKTENIVLSGATLKLIDFQSLTPLRTDSQRPLQIEHATPAYMHRRPSALGESLEARAEGTAMWACGVILTRLLAAELSSDWVHKHRGLGTSQELEEVLPDDHCLLNEEDPEGPRDLLDRIFSPEQTPSIMEVLMHPWVLRASEEAEQNATIEYVEERLAQMLPQGADPSAANLAWIPLTGCVCIGNQPPPLARVEEIISIATSLSDGQFRQDGIRKRHHTRPRRGSRVSSGTDEEVDNELEEETFHEFIIVSAVQEAEDEDANSDKEYNFVDRTASKDTASRVSEDDRRFSLASVETVGGGDENTPTVTPMASLKDAPSPVTTSPKGVANRAAALWKRSMRSLVRDRFFVQVRAKFDLADEEPDDVWWLRVKWLRPLVTGKKDTLGSLTTSARKTEHRPECSAFMQLQQLLMESRDEAEQRAAAKKAQEFATPRRPGGLMLPGIATRG